MTKITAKKDGASFQIFKGNDHIADYDPVDEKITFTETKFKRHTNAINTFMDAGGLSVSDDKIDPEVENKALSLRVESLEAEKAALAEKVEVLEKKLASLPVGGRMIAEDASEYPYSCAPKKSNSPRYEDDIDVTGAPKRDPRMGDLTPVFIEWARDNMPPEVFKKRYHRRVPGV